MAAKASFVSRHAGKIYLLISVGDPRHFGADRDRDPGSVPR
jgi:hypothetical protein